ncbi:MAG: N-acetyltransferase [Proteobacteria bacterium]|nr:MAG: N-acetyltransferase [Pseudomonadota bacterium]
MLDFHRARPEEKREAFADVHAIWPHAADPAVHLVKRLHAVQQSRAEWFVGRSQNGVEVSCGVYPFTLFGKDNVERQVRGFGAVYTHPRGRGHGYAGELIRFVRKHYQEAGVEDFILYSDIDPSFYERLGFHRLPSSAFEFSPKDLAADSPWTLEKTEALVRDPGKLGHDFGLKLSPDDLIWAYAKQDLPLRMTRFQNLKENLSYWTLSSLDAGQYQLLMSNIPQDGENWKLFHELVAADCAKSKGDIARGWRTARSLASEGGTEPQVNDRKDGILMWASQRGEKDPWFPEITKKGFLTFPLFQF